jgi:hypothetical protein
MVGYLSANVMRFTGEAQTDGEYHRDRRSFGMYTGSEGSDAGFGSVNVVITGDPAHFGGLCSP